MAKLSEVGTTAMTYVHAIQKTARGIVQFNAFQTSSEDVVGIKADEATARAAMIAKAAQYDANPEAES